MKNKLFYLVGAAFLLCSTGTFTSCVNGVDDEYLELANSGNGGGDNNGEQTEFTDLNGDYVQGGDFDLKMIYNGEELTGKKVTVAADEKYETAIFTLAGAEKDLSELVGGLLEFKFETFSPVPGAKEAIIPNVKLYNNGGTSYWFRGEHIDPTYTLAYEGTIEDGKMEISINHQLTNQKLVGTWDLAPRQFSILDQTWNCSPLWFDLNSTILVDLGFYVVSLHKTMNGIFSLLTGALSPLIMKPIVGVNIQTQDLIRNMLKGITAQPNGTVFATYSYSGDIQNPAWSSEMPHNALRYYYDPEDPNNRLYLEINADFLAGLIGGLINPVVSRADPGATLELGKQLIALLTPLLQKGIPCDYVLNGSNLAVNIDGVVLRDVLLKLLDLANDDIAKPVVAEFVNNNLGDFAPNIISLLRTLPYALKYYEADGYDANNEPINPRGECAYVKLGLKFVKAN